MTNFISTFKQSNHPVLFILKPVLVFFGIFIVSAIIAEICVIIMFLLLGFDLRLDYFPDNTFTRVVPLYGFVFFAAGTVLYCRVITKISCESIGLVYTPFRKYLFGFFVGALLVCIVVFLLIMSNAYIYKGINPDIQNITLIIFLIGFIIQGFAEELMIRGYLLMTLLKRTTPIKAVLISSIVFMALHLPTVMSSGLQTLTVGLLNLMLFSIFASIVMIYTRNIFVVGAIHSAWNFFLGVVFGIHVSGGNRFDSLFLFEIVEDKLLLNGGDYGLESGIVTMFMMLLAISIALLIIKKRNHTHYPYKQS